MRFFAAATLTLHVIKFKSSQWQWAHCTQMASTVTRAQLSIFRLRWCADNKSEATVWCYRVNMDQNPRGMFPAPCWIWATKIKVKWLTPAFFLMVNRAASLTAKAGQCKVYDKITLIRLFNHILQSQHSISFFILGLKSVSSFVGTGSLSLCFPMSLSAVISC